MVPSAETRSGGSALTNRREMPLGKWRSLRESTLPQLGPVLPGQLVFSYWVFIMTRPQAAPPEPHLAFPSFRVGS